MRKYINIKVLFSAILVAILIFGAMAALVWSSKPSGRKSGSVTAIVNIVPAASWTPVFVLPTQVTTATSTQGTSLPPGVIGIGSYVQVMGTGGKGLRLRVEPNLEAEVRLLGADDEIFEVQEGPQQSGGYTWWYLVGPYDEARHGWAVEDFLIVVQNP